MEQEQIDKKAARDAVILENLQDRYSRYVQYIKVDKNTEPSPMAHRFVFGNVVTGKICIALAVLLTAFFIVSIFVMVKGNSPVVGFVSVPIFYVLVMFFLISAIIQHFQEGRIIEEDKAEEADCFELEERGEDEYVVTYQITTNVTGTLVMESDVSKEVFEYLKTQEKVPVKIFYGRGLVYNLNFEKIRKNMEK